MGSSINAAAAFAPVAPPPALLSHELRLWLNEHALALDTGTELASELLPKLAASSLFGLGVPQQLGGRPGSSFADALDAVSDVAELSLTAAFVLWGQRSFIEYLLQTENAELRSCYLPDLLDGKIAGATGLSNAIKFLGGIEGLQVSATEQTDGSWSLSGRLPWVTNLRPDNYVVAVAVSTPNASPAIVAIHHDDSGQERSNDLPLIGLQASNTAALSFNQLQLSANRVLHDNAALYINQIRPEFLGLQCALTIGLVRKCVKQVLEHTRKVRILTEAATSILNELEQLRLTLLKGVDSGLYRINPRKLFEVRIALADLAAQAVALESASEGGVCYLAGGREHTLRRHREAMFVPLVSPTVVQLKSALQG
ncbi:acyl-CoA/acyl-ACP dehydrogenase [Paenalcaligenes niemegkensis]|uniref:acyl-CoA dehydrogenase family protein n=1 Tax=Paenalcaligenes niemegkensis TaxID=2895469 RepID=UPI001EE95687|nr:acyl-CoA dehydrogenase family protein [Paenalcaligenes niemegkensis]MCQ9616657.1 acyl-CoA/acyl-ACP dehydrogenase [Paenalcaligenes niemegkensis]